jgi:hypothetical protein
MSHCLSSLQQHLHFYSKTTLLVAQFVPSNPLTYAANTFCQSIHSFFLSYAQKAHINKMLLYSCHFCPITNLTVAVSCGCRYY